jgi:hypothetical protein
MARYFGKVATKVIHSFLTQLPMMRLYYLFVFVMLVLGCKEETKPPVKHALPPSQKVYLEGKTASMNLPLTFKRSSRYLLERDIPAFQKNQFALWMFQQRLERLEFQDSEIDVFADTTSDLHFLMILNMPHTPINKQAGNLLNGQINQMWRKIQASSGNLINVEKAGEATIRGVGKTTVLKFKHKVSFLMMQENVEFHTVFIVTSEYRTLMIMEVSENENDVEEYLWTLKN